MSDSPARPPDAHLLEMGRLAELGLHSAELVHELRQPLFAASSLGHLLLVELGRKEPDLARARDHVAVLNDQLELLSALLLRYGGAGRRADGAALPMLLAPPVTAAVQMFGGRARSQGIGLDLELVDVQDRVLGDPVAIQQVMINLVQNALDAAQTTVVVRVQGRVVEVRDDGPDLDADVIDHLFEPFFTTKAPGKGTGLGLAVARQLMRGLGGELELARQDGRTLFRATFQPCTPGANRDAP